MITLVSQRVDRMLVISQRNLYAWLLCTCGYNYIHTYGYNHVHGDYAIVEAMAIIDVERETDNSDETITGHHARVATMQV